MSTLERRHPLRNQFFGESKKYKPTEEQERQSSHTVTLTRPKEYPNFQLFGHVGKDSINPDKLTDEANFPGGESPAMFGLAKEAGVPEIATVVDVCKIQGKTLVVRGGGSSLTGAVVPRNDVILDVSERKTDAFTVEENEGKYTVSVKTGDTFRELNKFLDTQGLYIPTAPTYQDATITGAIATDAGGAEEYKYGKMGRFVEGLTLVTADGVLTIDRGQYRAHKPDRESPNGYFVLQTPDGDERRISLPTYTRPDVPKISAGYYNQPYDPDNPPDLIDYIIGSEGTLGVITDAKVRAIKKIPKSMALVPCDSKEQMFDLMKDLDTQEPEKRKTQEPGGISSVEFIGPEALTLIQQEGMTKELLAKYQLDHHEGGVLLVQLELPEGSQTEELFMANLEKNRVNMEKVMYAEPNNVGDHQEFLEIREDVPGTVNRKVKREGVSKVGGDPCVQTEKLAACLDIYINEAEAAKAGDVYYWGHPRNPHLNIVALDKEKLPVAKRALRNAGIQVIKILNGVGTAEHGVGKNDIKQSLLRVLYGKRGIEEMRAFKEAFDPEYIMGRGNLFPKEEPEGEVVFTNPYELDYTKAA